MSESSSFAAGSKSKTVASANHERRLRHRFHAARQHHIGFAQLNHLRRVDDGLHSRSAQTIHRESWRFDGQTGSQSDMARAVKSVARSLLRVAKNHVIEFFRVQPGALDGTLTRNGAEFLRREIFQLAAITSKGRTRPADNCDVSWF